MFVYDRTGSALAVGILNFATFLPILIFSVWGGVLSDRFGHHRIMQLGPIFGAVAVVIERTAYRPLRSAPRLIPLISAIGVAPLPHDQGGKSATCTRTIKGTRKISSAASASSTRASKLSEAR